MKLALSCLLGGAALLASGAAVARDRTADVAKTDPNKVVCRSSTDTGSRLSQSKQCMTNAQWAQAKQAARLDIDRIQANHVKN